MSRPQGPKGRNRLAPGHRLSLLRREIRRGQAVENEKLRSAFVGRPLVNVDGQEIFRQLAKQTRSTARYRSVGGNALVYLSRNEMRYHRGKTYFNQFNVQRAIETAPASVLSRIRIGRSALELTEGPFHKSPSGNNYYWVTAFAVSARTEESASVNMRREELAIANHLFLQDNDLSGSPVLRLGAIAANNFGDAQDILDTLDGIMPAEFKADPVQLIPFKDEIPGLT